MSKFRIYLIWIVLFICAVISFIFFFGFGVAFINGSEIEAWLAYLAISVGFFTLGRWFFKKVTKKKEVVWTSAPWEVLHWLMEIPNADKYNLTYPWRKYEFTGLSSDGSPKYRELAPFEMEERRLVLEKEQDKWEFSDYGQNDHFFTVANRVYPAHFHEKNHGTLLDYVDFLIEGDKKNSLIYFRDILVNSEVKRANEIAEQTRKT